MSRRCVIGLGFLLAGCLSTAPPAPPLRFFDATPTAAPLPVPAASVVVVSEPHVAPDFAVRVGPREVAFDSEHRWLSEPSQWVAGSMRAAGASSDGELTVRIVCFELDVTQGPRAHVLLRLAGPARLRTAVVDVFAPAADRSPEAFAAAMAEAIGKAAAAVVAAFGN